MYHRVGVFNGEGPPVPIPNTEVKLTCADDTCLATGRENRSTPTQKRDDSFESPLLFFVRMQASERGDHAALRASSSRFAGRSTLRSARSIFFDAHVAEENDLTLFAPAGANSARLF